MSRFEKRKNVTAVIVTESNGKESTAHVQDVSNPCAILFGSLGGYTMDSIKPLQQPTFDGAKSIIKVSGMPPWGVEIRTSRIKDSSEDILATFKAAGLENLPDIRKQGRFSKLAEQAKRVASHFGYGKSKKAANDPAP